MISVAFFLTVVLGAGSSTCSILAPSFVQRTGLAFFGKKLLSRQIKNVETSTIQNTFCFHTFLSDRTRLLNATVDHDITYPFVDV